MFYTKEKLSILSGVKWSLLMLNIKFQTEESPPVQEQQTDPPLCRNQQTLWPEYSSKGRRKGKKVSTLFFSGLICLLNRRSWSLRRIEVKTWVQWETFWQIQLTSVKWVFSEQRMPSSVKKQSRPRWRTSQRPVGAEIKHIIRMMWRLARSWIRMWWVNHNKDSYSDESSLEKSQDTW